MQNAGIAELGLNWRYLAFDVPPSELREAISGARAMRFIGLNLTVPHKLLAVEMVDTIDESARLWGAVNTIVFETRDAGGEWTPLALAKGAQSGEIRSHGFNTDADAVVKAIKEEFSWPNLEGASVLLIGAGGAARTAALRLAQEGVGSLFLANRTETKALEIAGEVAAHFPSVELHVVAQTSDTAAAMKQKNPNALGRVNIRMGYPDCAVDLLLNATSLGLKKDDALPVDLKWLKAHPPRRVFDMIYRPAETPLLREARLAGCEAANGVSMLLYQGEAALRLWTGGKAPVEAMRAALMRNVYGGAESPGGAGRL